MCHLGKWGIHPHPLPPCFVLFLKNLNTMPTREFWNDWLIFLLFSLILTFCSGCVYHNMPSSWHQNWCKVWVWRLGFRTLGCLRKTTRSSWGLEVMLPSENIPGFDWNGLYASQEGFRRSWTRSEQMCVPMCCFGLVRLEENLLRKSSSSKKRGSCFLSLWNPAGVLVSLDPDLNLY